MKVLSKVPMRIRIEQDMQTGLREIHKSPADQKEEGWIRVYHSLQEAMIDEDDIQLFPVALAGARFGYEPLNKRILVSQDDLPMVFAELNIHSEAAESYLIFCPPAVFSRPADEVDLIGALAIDIAEALLDLPRCGGYKHKVDAVLAYRAAMATLFVAHARTHHALPAQGANQLLGQIRRDFIIGVQTSYPKGMGFNMNRWIAQESPGLINAVKSITQDAVSLETPYKKLSSAWLQEQAEKLVVEHAPFA